MRERGERLAIRAGRLVDVEAGEVRDGQVLLVDGERVAAAPIDRSAAQEAFRAVRNARATVMAGFTTVRDVGTFRAFADVALRDAIDDGTVVGPRMAVAGAYVTVPGGGGGEITGLAPDVALPADLRFGVAASPGEVRERARAILHGGADFIKVIATGAVLAPGRYADLIAVPGDPLDDLGVLAEVPFVMQGGRVLKAPPEMRLPTAPI